MAKMQTLNYKESIKASPTEVYGYFTNPTFLLEWFCDTAHADVRKGGRLYLAWNDGYVMSSQFDTLTPSTKIAYRWNGKGESSSKVLIALKEKEGSTTVVVTHSEIAPDKKLIKSIDEGWKYALMNLHSVMETGEDRRITMRPMLGITGFQVVNAEMVKEMDLPIKEGIRIGGTVAGMGAEAAGLKGNDVVVSIGGKKINTFPSIANALQGRQAGEIVKVVVYRGKEKLTLPMQLSKRPLPAIPASGKEFAEALRNLFAPFDIELEKTLAGVTEEQAAYRPTEKEWSIKDVLAHLIIGERDNAGFLAESIEGAQRSYDVFPNNLDIRHQAIFVTHPTLKDLISEWRKAQRENLAMHELLPASFIARKGSYWRYAFGTLQGNIHLNDHLRQIKELVEKSRK